MKKIIFLLAFLIYIPSADAVYSSSATTILAWADSNIQQFKDSLRTIQNQSAGMPTNASCLRVSNFRNQFLTRLQLGNTEAQSYINMMFRKNSCLKQDLLEIDNRIGRITDLIFRYKPGCLSRESYNALNAEMIEIGSFIEQLVFMRSQLQKYGDNPNPIDRNGIRQQFVDTFDTPLPNELEPALEFKHDSYISSLECPEPKGFFAFAQAKAEFKRLMRRIDELNDLSSNMISQGSQFATGQASFSDNQLDNIRRRARYRASAWFESNITSQLQADFVLGSIRVKGPDPISQSTEGTNQNIDRNRDVIDTKAPKAKGPGDILADKPTQPIWELFARVDKSVKNREEVIDFHTEADALYTQVEHFDRELQEVLDRNPIPIMGVIDKKNEFYETATQAVWDLCNSMPTCK
jgi:hypothetical protein